MGFEMKDERLQEIITEADNIAERIHSETKKTFSDPMEHYLANIAVGTCILESLRAALEAEGQGKQFLQDTFTIINFMRKNGSRPDPVDFGSMFPSLKNTKPEDMN